MIFHSYVAVYQRVAAIFMVVELFAKPIAAWLKRRRMIPIDVLNVFFSHDLTPNK